MIKATFKRQKDYLEIALLIDNPFRDDSVVQAKSGKVNYRNFVQEITVTCNDRVVFSGQFNPGMASQPNVVFRAKHVLLKDTLKVEWLDNSGKTAIEIFPVTI